MAGSPVYKKEKQRVILGILTKRQGAILLIGFIFSFFILGHKKIDAIDYQWKVLAVSREAQDEFESSEEMKLNESTQQDDNWNALPTEQIVINPVKPLFEVKLKGIEYSGSVANLYWESEEKYKYQVYLNEILVSTTGLDFYQHDFSGGVHFWEKDLEPIFYVKSFLFLVFVMIAYIEINGTDPEKYLFRFVKQYIKFQVLFKIPIIDLPIILPSMKQNLFRVHRSTDLPDFMNAIKKPMVKNNKKLPELKNNEVIQKVFYAVEGPIEFTSSLKNIEIQHENIIVQMKRGKKGAIEIVFKEQ